MSYISGLKNKFSNENGIYTSMWEEQFLHYFYKKCVVEKDNYFCYNTPDKKNYGGHMYEK